MWWNDLALAGQPINGGDRHALGRAMLAKLYREATGRDLPPITVTPRGKPYFPDGAYHFSITHTRRMVFCALSTRPVGIDAEDLDRRVSSRLAERILSPGEYRQYLAAPDRNRALLTFWVLKEAQAKYTGQGLTGYPNRTDFSLSDPRVIRRDGCVLAAIMEDRYAF